MAKGHIVVGRNSLQKESRTREVMMGQSNIGGNAVQRRDESLGLATGVIKPERCTHGAFDSHRFHQWLGAVMACTHGNPQFVEKHAGVIMVCIANQERYNGTLTRRSAENTHPWNLHHLGRSPTQAIHAHGRR